MSDEEGRAHPELTRGRPEFPIQRAVLLIGDTLGRERSVAQAVRLVEAAAHRCEEHAALLRDAVPPAAPLACREGCAFCCRSEVIVTPVEVIRLVAWMRSRLSPERLDAVAARAGAPPVAVRPGDGYRPDLVLSPCPLLEAERCLAYPARPFVCRGANSFDARRCERAFDLEADEERVPVYEPQLHLWHALRAGVASGLLALGYQREFLSLPIALRIALNQPDAVELWLRGEDPFAEAQRVGAT